MSMMSMDPTPHTWPTDNSTNSDKDFLTPARSMMILEIFAIKQKH